MNLLVLLAVAAAMSALRYVDLRIARVHILGWMGAWLVAVYITLRFGIEPPVPSSIIQMFMAIVVLVLLTYLSADTERMQSAKRAVVAFMVERRFLIPLVVVVLLLPSIVAVRVYLDATARPQPPLASRTIHPPPPAQIQFEGETMNLTTATNPYRELEESDPEAFAEHVENGRRVYYANCVYCHGDNLSGNGHFAHAFTPIPANFQDPQTIGILQESYLFWRIAKGAPGLPDESTPWDSAMPAWENVLTEEEIWDVILFLYDFTGHSPRAEGSSEASH